MYNHLVASTRVENAPYRQEVMHEEMVLSSDLDTDRHEKGREFSEQMDPRARRRRERKSCITTRIGWLRNHEDTASVVANITSTMPVHCRPRQTDPSDEYMVDIHELSDGYDMPGAFHDNHNLDVQEQRIWDRGKDRQRNH